MFHSIMKLFDSWKLRGLNFRNRIFVSPMCQYSSEDGFADDWHLVHLGSRAVGGAGLVMTEATAVVPEGRISFADLGIWKDEHIDMLSRTAAFIHAHGAACGVQLAHAGRKASTARPWDGPDSLLVSPERTWSPIYGPTGEPFSADGQSPRAMSVSDIAAAVDAFAKAAVRARTVGFDLVEIHAAHGYLLSEFLSPAVNTRDDKYGGDLAGRSRFLLETVDAVRKVWPEELPLFVRINSVDWLENGWTLEESVALAKMLSDHGVDLLDCSSGGATPDARPETGPGYQTAFASHIRREARIATGAVGMITEPVQADHIIRTGQADAVFLARELLRDPYWPLRAASALGEEISWPDQYKRAAR